MIVMPERSLVGTGGMAFRYDAVKLKEFEAKQESLGAGMSHWPLIQITFWSIEVISGGT